MNIFNLFKNHLSTLLLLLVIGLQLILLNALSVRESPQAFSRVYDQLTNIQQQLDHLNMQQPYINTPEGVSINVTKHEVEQAVAQAVRDMLPGMLTGKLDVPSPINRPADYVETPLTPQQEQNRFESQQAVNQVVDNAILMGHWTKQDTQSLLPHMGNLSTAQRNELIKKFTDAISHNRMQLDAPPPPL